MGRGHAGEIFVGEMEEMEHVRRRRWTVALLHISPSCI